MAEPRVGITWSSEVIEHSLGPGEDFRKYADLVSGAAMAPVLIPPGFGRDLVNSIDALLLPGGPDIAPWLYAQPADEHLGEVDPARDELELTALDHARAANLPILGICRGLQLINVALGGTLSQHISHPQWRDDPSLMVHEVRVVAGTLLHRALDVETTNVNSGHHQAVDHLAAPLRPSAFSPDGHAEALESEELRILAVQWHPEEMPHAVSSHRLMMAFARWLRT